MTHSPPIIDLQAVFEALLNYRWRWLMPAVVCTLLALGFAVCRSPVWEASQQLTLRDEATGTVRSGRFADADAMKHAQETAVELVRSEPVVRAALEKVGPPPGTWFTSGWPSNDDVASTQGAIKISAPNGAELGKTEVFYLRLKSPRQDRAIELASAVCEALEDSLRELRKAKATSLKEEMERSVQIARDELQVVSAKVSELERNAGRDLSELRGLNQSSGEGNLRQTLVSVRNDLRQAELAQLGKQKVLAQLKAAQADPNQLVATPNELLESQPALRRLKDGLVDSQLQGSQLLAQMSPEHPRVLAAVEAQREIRTKLFNELETAVRGLQSELNTNMVRLQSLENQMAELEARLGKLAQVRVEYSNLSAALDQRNDVLRKSEETLAIARASYAAADSASLLTRMGEPVTGNHPVGPGRTVIVLGGAIGGLALGLGLLFLTVPFRGAAIAVAQPVVATKAASETSPRPATESHAESRLGAVLRSPLSTKPAEEIHPAAISPLAPVLRIPLPEFPQRDETPPTQERYAAFVLGQEAARSESPLKIEIPPEHMPAIPAPVSLASSLENQLKRLADETTPAPLAESPQKKKPSPPAKKAAPPAKLRTAKTRLPEAASTADSSPEGSTHHAAPGEPKAGLASEEAKVPAAPVGEPDLWGGLNQPPVAGEQGWVVDVGGAAPSSEPPANATIMLDRSLAPTNERDSLGVALSRIAFAPHQAG